MTTAGCSLTADSAGPPVFRAAPVLLPVSAYSPFTAPGVQYRSIIFPVASP